MVSPPTPWPPATRTRWAPSRPTRGSTPSSRWHRPPATVPAAAHRRDLAAVTIPSLVLVGTNDQTTPADPNVDRPWELTNSSPRYRGDLARRAASDVHRHLRVPADGAAAARRAGADPRDDRRLRASRAARPTTCRSTAPTTLTNTFAVAFLESIFRNGQMIDPTHHRHPRRHHVPGRVAPVVIGSREQTRRHAAVCSREQERS